MLTHTAFARVRKTIPDWLGLGLLMSCAICEFPERKVWPPLNCVPSFQDISSKNWMSLSECSSCQTLWVCVPYEPYASFPYYVVWSKNKSDWQQEIIEKDGAYLHEWHKQELIKHKGTLTIKDIAAIERHRIRSSGRDPYNEN